MVVAAHPLVHHIEPLDPGDLVGDKVQPGHPLFGLIWINAGRVSGAPCFYGTRVPIQNLFDSLGEGESLEAFLQGFPGVSREQALAVVQLAGTGLMHDLEQHCVAAGTSLHFRVL